MILNSVLIIDDSEEDQYLLKRMITETHLAKNIFQETDGKFGLDFLMKQNDGLKEHGDKFPPQLIFLDVNMPLIDGFKFLEEFSKLKEKSEYLKSVIVMMFTSAETEESKKRALSYPFVKDYIVKSPTEEALKEVVQRYFDNN